jgi:L-alanine-DL-glutamate epimerase-like enolase superfamily enzyme
VNAGWDLRVETLRLPFRDPFVIARYGPGEGRAVTTVVVELRSPALPGLVGVGEGCPESYYGETASTMAVVMPRLLEAAPPGLLEVCGLDAARDSLVAMSAAFEDAIRGHGAAKCALDIALHDLAGKALGVPMYHLLGLSPRIPPTDFTLGLDEPAVVAERARRATRFPALKIKVGGAHDLATLEAVRGVYTGPIRIDANIGWTPQTAAAIVPELVRLGVELVEQPFPPRRYDWLRDLQASCPLPIVADESAVFVEDLEALVGVVDGVNVKLAKCGGVGPAARMLARARALGFRTFLGCMEETSVGIAASAAVASLADWVDLDGCLLLADDPFEGLELDDACRWRLSDGPGHGVSRRPTSVA